MLSADHCFIGGEEAAKASPGLVGQEWCSHKCAKKATDMLETTMEEIEVLGLRQIVFKSDQENPAKAVRRELAGPRPEMIWESSQKQQMGLWRTQCSACSARRGC